MDKGELEEGKSTMLELGLYLNPMAKLCAKLAYSRDAS